MDTTLPVTAIGSEEEVRRLEGILRAIAATPTGHEMFFGGKLRQAKKEENYAAKFDPAAFARVPKNTGAIFNPLWGRIFLRPESPDAEVFGALAHELCHAYEEEVGLSRAKMTHPIGKMVASKWREASAESLAAQICWEYEHMQKHGALPDLKTWESFKENSYSAARAFEERCQKSVSAAESGEARAAAAGAILDRDPYMKDLEETVLENFEKDLARTEKEKAAESKPHPAAPASSAPPVAASSRKTGGPAELLEKSFVFNNMAPDVKKRLFKYMMLETKQVRKGNAARLDALLVKMGEKPAGMREVGVFPSASLVPKPAAAPLAPKFNRQAARKAPGLPKVLGPTENKTRINRLLAEIAGVPEGARLLAERPAGEEPCNVTFDDKLCMAERCKGFYHGPQDIVRLDSRFDDARLAVILFHELVHERQEKNGIASDMSGDPIQNAAIKKAREADAYAQTAQFAWQSRASGNEKLWKAFSALAPHMAENFEAECAMDPSAADTGVAKAVVFAFAINYEHGIMAGAEKSALAWDLLRKDKLPTKRVDLSQVFGKLDIMKGMSTDLREVLLHDAMTASMRLYDCNRAQLESTYGYRNLPLPTVRGVPFPKPVLQRLQEGVASILSTVFNGASAEPVARTAAENKFRPPEMR